MSMVVHAPYQAHTFKGGFDPHHPPHNSLAKIKISLLSWDSVVPRDHVLASDWIRNGKRLIRETRQSIVRTNLSYAHCAFIQFSDPVNLTDTPEMKIRNGFPSAVPWWSVEIRRGPAFL